MQRVRQGLFRIPDGIDPEKVMAESAESCDEATDLDAKT